MVSPAISLLVRPKLSSRARLQTDRITGKPMLLYPEGALMLNPTAHAILCLCTGQQTLEAIISGLENSYGNSVAELPSQVNAFLNRLRAKNLLELI